MVAFVKPESARGTQFLLDKCITLKPGIPEMLEGVESKIEGNEDVRKKSSCSRSTRSRLAGHVELNGAWFASRHQRCFFGMSQDNT